MSDNTLRTHVPARPHGTARETRALQQGRVFSFLRSEDGSMSIFALFTALSLVAIGGIGIDYMVAEYKRTNLQNTLDRAVLAAADLEQMVEPDLVVVDYLSKMSLGDALTKVTSEQGVNFKDVSGEASTELASNFTSILGVQSLNASASSRAEERIANVEISLVLDISGSMAQNAKMANLRSAADTFIDTVLTDENEDLISISLVPYSEHVNAGPELTSRFDVAWRHPYSHCLEVDNSQFDDTAFDMTVRYEQAQHFQYNSASRNTVENTVCPRYSYERIRTMSKDAEALKGQIAQFTPRAGTSIFMGMKWAAALLDPAHRPLIDGMIGDGQVDGVFAGRPADWNDVNTLKTIVLMTDGEHDRSHRIYEQWYNSPSEYEHWNLYNATWWRNQYLSSSQRQYFYEPKYSKSEGDELLGRICDAAKERDIVIWSIGFEVQDHGAEVMKNCASSPAHFFRVEGTEIETAFYSIARAINQLRLIQ
ncbi:hypothetical protein OCH239_04940 [Roseivivax halodurans JCM 10272]|uniref:Putative Flp pilus-assembly TadG-like N-terminal domain-containing protein n=1 Tax=Roseivivax halodurans JCM 10272 TaxID=1449350 RepID=X7EE87_9RHOB|nr:TadE/TadG family type IV pilus assembly protein [Roseivivax halodurans]ETX14200.1 hypothetical protein OCH239_04940 [Roseivivax halodurans JCM 10272]